jgi:hypothetical protein
MKRYSVLCDCLGASEKGEVIYRAKYKRSYRKVYFFANAWRSTN